MSTDEFWTEDAARLTQIEEERSTGIRMPQKAVERAEPAVIYRAQPQRSLPWGLILGCLALLLVVSGIGWVIYSWPVITREEFDRLEPGMSLDECEGIIGAKSSDEMEFEMPTPKLVGFKVTSVSWGNKDGSGAAASFVDDRLVMKLFVSSDGIRTPVAW